MVEKCSVNKVGLGIFLKTYERFFLQFADTLKCAEAIKIVQVLSGCAHNIL